MKTIVKLLFVLALSVVAFQPAGAQFQPAISLLVEQVNNDAFPSFALRLSAWDSNGLPLKDLKVEQISLKEDDGEVFYPDSVQANTDAPLQVALVLDVSGSMEGQPLQDAKAASARFLDRLNADDQVAVIAFSDGVDPDSEVLDPQKELDFTNHIDLAYNLVDGLEAAGGTHLYNAASKAVRLFDGGSAGHRAVLLLTDGRNDPPNIGDSESAIQLAVDAGIPIFVIGMGNEIDQSYLQRLASETGGLYRSAPGSADLASLFDNMADLLKTQYEVLFTSTLPADGEQHRLALQIETENASGETSILLGRFPLMPTAEPKATEQPAAKNVAQPVEPATLQTQVLTEQNEDRAGLSWVWFAAGAVVFGIGFVVFRNKQHAQPEVCAKCGYDLTGKTGACPQCGETRRLPKP